MSEYASRNWPALASQIMLWTSLLVGRAPSLEAQPNEPCCQVLELRQYTLYAGKRDVLIDLFEREFIESQEQLGAKVVGQFRDLDNPDRFAWLRGFRDMDARLDGLQSFYGGPVWKAHRDEANATMADSNNVLLLRWATPMSGFAPSTQARPGLEAREPAKSIIVATIYYLNAPVDEEFLHFFEDRVRPVMTASGAAPLAYFQTETAENNFPRLPVRTGENVFVWFARFAKAEEYTAHVQRLERTKNWSRQVEPELLSHLQRPPEHLRLQPTKRSLLR